MEGLVNLAKVLAIVVILISPKPTLAIDFGVQAPLQEPITRPGLFKFLDECSKHNTPMCGKEIFDAIFKSGNVTEECCHKLLVMGKNCHDSFVNYIAHGPSFRAWQLQFLAKSEQVYETCVSIVTSPASPFSISIEG